MVSAEAIPGRDIPAHDKGGESGMAAGPTVAKLYS